MVRRGDSHTTRRERFHHVSLLIDRLLYPSGPPHVPELNGDDRMAAEPEQRPCRQTHPRITAAEHKASQSQVSHLYHQHQPAKRAGLPPAKETPRRTASRG